MVDHPELPTQAEARSESGLTDDDFAPVWSEDDRPAHPPDGR